MSEMDDNPSDLTIVVLRQIRDEIIATRSTLSDRIDHVRTELSERIDHVRTELSTRIDHLDSTMGELAQQQSFIVRNLRGLGERDRHVEDEVDALRDRVDALEKRVPG